MLITLSDSGLQDTCLEMQIAAEAIIAGGTVIVGTETFYALAANPFIDKAVEKVFSIKKRPFQNPLPLIAAGQEFVNLRVNNLSQSSRALMKAFWPGSLTILLYGKGDFSKYVRNVSGQIGVRVSPGCPARYLANKVGGWITATSANISGDPAPTLVTEIPSEIIKLVDVVIDSGPCPGGLPSTVIDASNTGWKVLRIGGVSEKAISEVLGQYERNQIILT